MSVLDEQLIRSNLPEGLRDMRIIVLDTTVSTNTYAKALDASKPVLITAASQTGGRGRLGKSFYSPKDSGIYMTVAYDSYSSAEYVTVATAVAVATVFDRLGAKGIGIKWVNDIFFNKRKVCGILCEGAGNKIIIGIGANLTTSIFPKDIAEIAGSLNLETDRNTIIAHITAEVLTTLSMSAEEIITEYKKYLFILGQKIIYTKDGIVKEGIATDVNEKGNLIVKSEAEEDVLVSGEISLDSKNFI